jgi:hypothetical protein
LPHEKGYEKKEESNMHRILLFIILSLAISGTPRSVYAQEEKKNAPSEEPAIEETSEPATTDYKGETERLLNEATEKLDRRSISTAKKAISAENYLIALRKAVMYGAKLAIYTASKAKLAREKTRRILKCKEKGCTQKELNKIEKGMSTLSQNVDLDIDTFTYGIKEELGRCRYAKTTFDNSFEDEIYNYESLEGKIERLFKTREYKTYMDNINSLLRSFPKAISPLNEELNEWVKSETPRRGQRRLPIANPDILKGNG